MEVWIPLHIDATLPALKKALLVWAAGTPDCTYRPILGGEILPLSLFTPRRAARRGTLYVPASKPPLWVRGGGEVRGNRVVLGYKKETMTAL